MRERERRAYKSKYLSLAFNFQNMALLRACVCVELWSNDFTKKLIVYLF